MKQLILVHGMNNQDNDADKIESDWTKAISIGAGSENWQQNVNVVTAFYGDVLFKETESWDGDISRASKMSIEAPDTDYVSADISSLYLEFQRTLNISDAQVRKNLDPSDDPQQLQRQGKGIHKSWLKAIVRTLEDWIPGAAAPVAEKFLRQAAAYMFKPNLMNTINKLVYSQIDHSLEDPSDTVVVAHSLGTIVTFMLLRTLEESKSVNLYLTAGSPLGIDVVKKSIQPKYLRPLCVSHWINASDKEDFVALHPELRRSTFGPAGIENISDLDNGDDDPHDISKYLAHERIAKRIVAALGQ